MEAAYEFQFTEKHLLTSMLRYREQIWWHRPFVKYRWPFALVALAAFGLGVYFSQFLAIAAGGILIGLLAEWPMSALVSKSRFRKSPYHNDRLRINLSQRGLAGIGESSKIELQWSVLAKARRFKDGLMLFQGPHVFHWLPDTAAKEPSTVRTAIELITAHVGDYRNA